MRRRTGRAAFLCAALLLSGCVGPGMAEYPYVSPEKRMPHDTVRLAVAQEEEWMLALGSQLSELVASYSDGAIRLLLVPSARPEETFGAGEADLVFLSTDEMTGRVPSLSFLTLPFLFGSLEDFLAAANAPEGPVRSSPDLVRCPGELLGVFYDRSWMMAVNRGRPPEDPVRGRLFGVNLRHPDRRLFLILGARDTAFGNGRKLWQLQSQGETDAIEFEVSDPERIVTPETAFLASRHRMEGRFLIYREGRHPPEVRGCLEKAVSESLREAGEQRWEEELKALSAIAESAGTEILGFSLRDLRRAAFWEYEFSPEDYGLSRSALEFLRLFRE